MESQLENGKVNAATKSLQRIKDVPFKTPM